MEEKFGRGDIIWVQFNPTRGSEQKGRRPAVVLSPESYNSKSSLMIVVPITRIAKGYPFEVDIKARNVSGVVLTDQIRTIDWRARAVQKVGRVSDEKLRIIGRHLNLLLPT